MINLKLLNEALGEVSSDEFAVLYFICNALSLQKTDEVVIKRIKIAERLGWYNEQRPNYPLKKVSKITTSLEEKGFINKKEIFTNPKQSEILFSLPAQKVKKDFQFQPQKVQKSVPPIKGPKEIKEIKQLKETKEQELELVCSGTNKGYDIEEPPTF